VINGGNYDFHGAVTYPLLLTPVRNENNVTTYKKTRLATSNQPRLYHNVALLLPDASVFVAGGNAARATLDVDAPQAATNSTPGRQPKPNLRRVDISTYFFGDGPIGTGHHSAPAENWVAEIFHPPYLFIDGNRRTVIQDVQLQNDNGSFQSNSVINGKPCTLLHSNHTYVVTLGSLPQTCPVAGGSLVIIKLGSSTHGWDSGQRLFELSFRSVSSTSIEFTAPDRHARNIAPAFYMLFYVDCAGKPTVARTVRFDDAVNQCDG
jgi:hypothetical protein